MNPSTLRLVLLLVVLAVAVLFSVLVAGLAGLLARHTGASYACALLRAGAAFAATAGLALAVLTLAATVV
ncbi:hypothetical protein ACFCWG_22270 [Streptomyces sp. NPDC056390]|uniref:hypothetical protein n=1 Tax=Streptomyces sp. NPDC056390 TaxID=3345806 RepID=UPI0035E353E3